MVNRPLRQKISTQTGRPLPNFAVIGAMRAATTMVHELLASVDEFSLPRMKETDFFVREENIDSGRKCYGDYFDKSARFCGEVAPNYTKRDIFPDVAARLHRTNPDARLIYIVRNPVARAISHYRHSFLMGQEMPAPADLVKSSKGQHIIATSKYAFQLEPWRAFFDIDQLLVVDFDLLITDTPTELRKISAHIGLPEAQILCRAGPRNSMGDVASMPGWWPQLRKSIVGRGLRTLLPRGVARRTKGLVSGRGPAKVPPAFPAAVVTEIEESLRDDIAAFRNVTGLQFSRWSI